MFNSLSFALKATVIGLFLASGFVNAAESALQKVEGGEDLEKVKRSKFKEAYVKPDVDFSHYNKVFIGEALFDYRDVKPSKMTSGIYSNTTSSREHPIEEEDRKQFQAIVSEAFRTEIVKGKNYTIVEVDQVDEHTLIMRGVVADIVSRVPPSNVRKVDVYMASVGSATLGLEFLDGTSFEVLARVAEPGRIGDARNQIDRTSRPVNRATITGDIKRWANGAARKLRTALDSALKE